MMPTSRTITTRIEEARRGRGEDRIAVVESVGRKLVIVADGAGGVAGGAATAEVLCRALTDAAKNSALDWPGWLEQQDTALATRSGCGGLAAAVVLSITDDGEIHGASVGDCEVWVFTQGAALNLTERQVRKPLIGEGVSAPVGFTAQVPNGTIVIASDGLWKYVKTTRIAEAAALRPLESAVEALVNGARLRSGALQDDIAIVILEVKRS